MKRALIVTVASVAIAVASVLPKHVAAASPAPAASFGITVAAASPQPFPTGFATEIHAGQGYSDVSPHQIVRTSGDVLYAAAPSCDQASTYPYCYQNYLAMEKAGQTGKPSSFSEQDVTHRPVSATSSDSINTSALAIDGNNVIWVGYVTNTNGIHVRTFNTSTNTWGIDYRLGSVASAYNAAAISQGKEGISVAVNASGTPVAVFSYAGSSTNGKYLGISSFVSGAWTTPVRIDDATLSSGQSAIHPAIGYTSSGTLLVAWLVGSEGLGSGTTYRVNDGSIHVRQITDTTPSSTSEAGPASVEIPDTGHVSGTSSNGAASTNYAATCIDNGPSLLLTPDGVAHTTWMDDNDDVRYAYSSNYTTWNLSDQTPTQQTHDPSLGPDGQGGVYIYGHGTPVSNQDGHGDNQYRFHKLAGSTTWSSFTEVVADTNIDDSVSTLWSQFYFNNPSEVAWLYFSAPGNPNTNYVSQF